MKPYVLAFIFIFCVFAGGYTALGLLVFPGLMGPGWLTWRTVFSHVLPGAALSGLSAGLFGCLLLRLFGTKDVKGAIRGRCPSCGYNLTGNETGVCPECGRPTSRARP